LVALANDENSYRGTSLPSKIAAIASAYASDQTDISSLYSSLASRQSAQSSFLSYLSGLAKSTVITMVNADQPQANSSLKTALTALVSQMYNSSSTIQANTVGSSTSAASGNIGNGNLVVSTQAGNGRNLELMFAETLTATVTGDSQSGGAIAGSEPLTVQGQAGSTSTLDFTYPGGSNASKGITAVNAALSNQSGTQNLLSNSDFETFVSNVPTGWTIVTGTAGTQVLQGGSPYTGASSLEIVGDGSTLTCLRQTFGSGNTSTLSPYTPYMFNCQVKVSSVPAAGVLQIALVNGSGTIIQDASGNNCSVSLNLNTGATTSYAPFSGTFRLPRVIPSTVSLQIALTTALSAGSDLFMDHLGFAKPSQIYTPGGPYVTYFSGSTPSIQGDSYSIAITNAYNGVFQTGLNRLLGTRTLGLLFPSAASSPTIADSLAVG
jgi:hypothetical protein